MASSSRNQAAPSVGAKTPNEVPREGSAISQETAASQEGKKDTAQPSNKSKGFSFAFCGRKQPSAAKPELRQPLQVLQDDNAAGEHMLLAC